MRILRHKVDGKFMLIPKAVFWDSRIRGLPMQILGIILAQSDKWNGVSMKWLAAQTGASETSIKEAMKKLVECDYARPYKGVKAQYSYYTFSDTPMTEEEKAECDKPKQKKEVGFFPDTKAGDLAYHFKGIFSSEYEAEDVGRIVKTFNKLLEQWSFDEIRYAIDETLAYSVGVAPEEPLGAVVNFLKKRCSKKSDELASQVELAKCHIFHKRKPDFLADDTPDVPYEEIPF